MKKSKSIPAKGKKGKVATIDFDTAHENVTNLAVENVLANTNDFDADQLSTTSSKGKKKAPANFSSKLMRARVPPKSSSMPADVLDFPLQANASDQLSLENLSLMPQTVASEPADMSRFFNSSQAIASEPLENKLQIQNKTAGIARLGKARARVKESSGDSFNQTLTRQLSVASIFTMDSTVLYYGFGKPTHYPLDEVTKLKKTLLDSEQSYNLDFAGIEQLSDLVFFVLAEVNDRQTCSCVKILNITGCLHITDAGLYWAAKAFPKLTQVLMNGCPNITESGLYKLMSQCKDLKDIEIMGTNVCVLPKQASKLNISLSGFPCVSPELDFLKKQGVASLEAPNYSKPKESDIVKMCVVHGPDSQLSFIKYLQGQKALELSPLAGLTNCQISARFKANIIESHESLADYFITKRTVFVFVVTSNETKEVAGKRIFGLICHIINKVHDAVFLMAAIKPKAGDAPPLEAVASVVEAMTKMKSNAMTKAHLADFNAMTSRSSKMGTSLAEQKKLASKILLVQALARFELQSMMVDVTKPFKKDGDLSTPLVKAMEKLIGLYPEYQDIGAPVYKFLEAEKTEEMFKGGALSVAKSKTSNSKMIELLTMMGRAVWLNVGQDVTVVSRVEYMSKILCKAMSAPASAKNDTRVMSLDESVLVWKLSDLEEELKKDMSAEEAKYAVSFMMKIGVSVQPSAFLPFRDLQPAPNIPLDHYFPEIPPYEKKKDLFLTVGYKATFDFPVPGILLNQMIGLCSSARRPSLLWSRGFVILEGATETLVEWRDHERGDGSSLWLVCHTVKKNQGSIKESTLEEMVWNTILQYKIVLQYVLTLNKTPHSLELAIGKQPSAEACVAGLMSSHMFSSPKAEDGKPPKTVPLCSICGMTPKVSSLYWTMSMYVRDSFLTKEMVTPLAEDTITQTGNQLNFVEAGSATINSMLSSTQQGTFKIGLISGKVDGLSITLAHMNVQVMYQIGSGKVTVKIAGGQWKEISTVPPDRCPTLGDTVSLQLHENEEVMMSESCELVIKRNTETIATVPVPRLKFKSSVASSHKGVTIMVYPLLDLIGDKPFEVVPGMRLEALDRLNPQLVCAATVDKILENGDWLIHFDGWEKTYDYTTSPDHSDLHPVGWMAANAQDHTGLNKMLQSPRGWPKGKKFVWADYCKDVNNLPVPFERFNARQIGQTANTEELSCLMKFQEVVGNLQASSNKECRMCPLTPNRSRVIEKRALNKCMMSPALFDFFTNHSRFFCLLPSDLDLRLLRNPSLQSVMDFTKQNVHILCPGLKMELLHYVDHQGVLLKDPDAVASLANYLQSCYAGLIAQDDTLPLNCVNLVKGMDNVKDEGQFEIQMQRLMMLYMFVLEIHMPDEAQKKVPRAAMDIFTTALQDKDTAKLFSEGDKYVRCKGHSASLMVNSDLRYIPEENFRQFYRFMTRLDFQNNLLEKLPDNFFENFKMLENLNVANNQLTELPHGLSKLVELATLDISSNQISKFPDDIESLANTLVSLNISNNPLVEFPAAIFRLTQLEELFAENIGTVKDLSPIKNLTNLNTLNLGKNLIPSIPDALGDLPLVFLDLSGIPWIEVTKHQLTLQAFEQLLNANNILKQMNDKDKKLLFKSADIDESSTLTPNEIITLNHDILLPKYPRFGLQSMAYEKTGGIPAPILRLTSLKTLILCYHAITKIPDEIAALTHLNHIDLSYNPRLQTISAELGSMPLRQIGLHECVTLNTPPKEIVSRGLVAIMGYFRRLRLGASPCKRTKLMLVGLGGAGKTSLVQSLMNKRYRAYIDYDDPITDGIDICNWAVPIGQDDVLTYSVWDFAGQAVYYNTHQFFLSNRAVYLLLWNVRQGSEHAGLDFWLSSVACHAPKAPIFVVGTHIDKVEKYNLAEENLKQRYPQISGFFYVSAYTGDGIEVLKNEIIKQTLKQKYMGEQIPAAWLTLEKTLIKYREEKSKDILPFKSLGALCHSCGIFDRSELVQAIQFLHDLGAVQFFDTDFLREMVVIYPQWIIDVMACLVTVHEGAVKEGRLLTKDISVVWKDYPADLHPWLLRLTEEFDLTCPIRDEPASIVPCLLPNSEPQFEWPHADPDKGIHESMTIYRFQYLPAGLFNRAQVRMHQYSTKGALLWKKGSFMKKNNHIAIMTQTDDQEVIVRAQGFKPDNLLYIVHEMIETLIAESYAGVNYDYLVPCSDCLNMNVKDPSMVSRNQVYRAAELNVPFLQCGKFFHILSIQELKDSMPSDKMSDVDSHLRNTVRELMDLNEETTVNTFFLYSSKNVPDSSTADKVVHPATIMQDLRKKGNFQVSYTDKPESSDMEALTMSVKAVDVVLVGMSDEFCEDPECRKLLLYIKDTLRQPVLLILLGTTKKWQKGDLNMSFSTEVYVDMQNKQRYPHKIEELFEAIKKKSALKRKGPAEKSLPKCFISYCWTNSHDAIAKGSRLQEGALGWDGGDPRKAKEFLTEKSIGCWIDVEQVGGTGLFTSIADGLKQAEVMVAFVSDEYVKSKNCVMEFRYGLTTLRIPVIVVVVGTGYQWERSEIGLLVVGHQCPKVNFQYNNETGNLELLKLIQERISKDSSASQSTQDPEAQRMEALQEVLELTQRKFLRHITANAIDIDAEPYPSLVVVDLLRNTDKKVLENMLKKKKLKERKSLLGKAELEKIVEGEVAQKAGESKGEGKTVPTEEEELDDETIQVDVSKEKYCFRLLCENPTGWHTTTAFIPFPTQMDQEEKQQLIDTAAPYLGRMYAIAKHSKIQLECLTTPEGEIFQQRIDEIGSKSKSDFIQEYQDFRNVVIQNDKSKIGQSALHKCQVNGKMVWLCEDHKKASRSKTEEIYEAKLSQSAPDIPIPTGGISEEFMQTTVSPPEEEKPQETTHRKIFKRASNQRPKIQRQTSQACSMM